ncbi:exodeoxyribonuclease VII small subunit [Asticcacaulis sp. AC402]|uniref:exodeoxyribonuclease VII small subunit n=1 Tax=Asticcacaulis sp. AC402 TaxID=1282361 RepID=UPI0003C3D264|nr:exodeoxyribonuclease VII small subunit [Asticcacaulis sp. AC402]ESQ76648.1 exodeoxyribonuclease VII small subunit [Asticcacaulis sp. AC402]
MSDTPNLSSPELSFEEALKQLERIVTELESGQAPLEQSLKLYERGAELKALCEARLEAARLQVEKISLSKAGVPEGVVPADFS